MRYDILSPVLSENHEFVKRLCVVNSFVTYISLMKRITTSVPENCHVHSVLIQY
jgi:hypothetical protein